MAAVARDINDLVAFMRQLAHALSVMHVNALISRFQVKPSTRSVRRIIS